MNWLVAAFVASLIPIGGVIVMLAVWWRGDDTKDQGGGSGEDSASGAGNAEAPS